MSTRTSSFSPNRIVFKSVFLKYDFFKKNLFIYLNHFNMLMLKIKKNYFNIFLNIKKFKKQLISYSQTVK